MAIAVGGTWGDLSTGARTVAAATTAGVAMGALVGGLGGRLAMLVLRLTSDPSLHGLQTDDDFTIGVISAATLFLVVVCALLGALGAIAYLLVRSWLPPAGRPAVFGALTGVVGGSLVIHPDGLDFSVLEPLWLAIVMFVALPAGYGVAVAALVERWASEGSSFARSRASLAALVLVLPPFMLLGVRGIAVFVVLTVAFVVGRRSSGVARLWRSPPVVWLGRAALLTVGVAASVSLVSDIGEIL